MFSGCPFRPSRSRDRVISRTNWWIPAKLGSCMYLAEPMNWLDFGVTRSKVKGHRANYVCKNSSWSRYLKNPLLGSRDPRSKVTGLIMYAKIAHDRVNLKHLLLDSCQTWSMYVSSRANELIRFWGHEVKCQRSQGSLCMHKKACDHVISRTDWWIPSKLGSCICIFQSQWID